VGNDNGLEGGRRDEHCRDVWWLLLRSCLVVVRDRDEKGIFCGSLRSWYVETGMFSTTGTRSLRGVASRIVAGGRRRSKFVQWIC
jgi:hypothetical protein